MKVVIIEDEKGAVNILKYLLKTINKDMNIVGVAEGVTEAYTIIQQKQPDLVFLDIKLKDGSAFDLLKMFNEINFWIIFTTAYNDFAIKAFKFSAIDYLLKPIDIIDLKEAINRAKKLNQIRIKHREMLLILQNYLNNKIDKIVLNLSDEKKILLIKNIIRLEADGAYTVFITNEGKITTSKNLKNYQEMLGNEKFIRIHQSHLINKDFIKSYEKSGYLILKNDEKIPVSFRKRNLIKTLLKEIRQ